MEYHQTSTAEKYSYTYIATDVNEHEPIMVGIYPASVKDLDQDANNKPQS